MAKPGAAQRREMPTRPGDIWAIPVPKLGYVPLVVTRVPPQGSGSRFAFAYVRPVLSVKPQGSVPPISDWDSAHLGLFPLRAFSSGRWIRGSSLRGFAADDWPIPPFCDGVEGTGVYSIELTPDEPTMTLLENVGSWMDPAKVFPEMQICNTASGFEKALKCALMGMPPTNLDDEAYFEVVNRPRLVAWKDYVAARRRRLGSLNPVFSPGKETQRRVGPGSLLGIPLTGGGFGAVLVVRRTSLPANTVMSIACISLKRQFSRYPTVEEVGPVSRLDAAFFHATGLLNVQDGRWLYLGQAIGFRPEDWRVPPHLWSCYVNGDILHLKDWEGCRDEERVRLPTRVAEQLAAEMKLTQTVSSTTEFEIGLKFRGALPAHCEEDHLSVERLELWEDIYESIRHAPRLPKS